MMSDRRVVFGFAAAFGVLAVAVFGARECRRQEPEAAPRPPEPAPAAPRPPVLPELPPVPPPAAKAPSPAVPAVEERRRAPPPRTGWGLVRGRVRALGDPPRRPRVRVDSHARAAALYPDGIWSDEIVVSREGDVWWALVHVKSGVKESAFPPAETPLVLELIGFRYVPHVFGIRAGQRLMARSADAGTHVVRVEPFANLSAVRPIGPEEADVTAFRSRELAVAVRCKIHPWERAWAGVLDHPLFSVTNEHGQYALPRMAPGRYTLEVWHEKYASVAREVDVEEGREETLDFFLDARK